MGDNRLLAFALFEGLTVEECEEVSIDGAEISYGGGCYHVCTDEEADELTAEYIKESVWAFNPGFLSNQTGIDQEVFEMLSEKCEGANDAILSMIDDFKGFVADAIAADGRGHFLNNWDGSETEQKAQNEMYFIYRN